MGGLQQQINSETNRVGVEYIEDIVVHQGYISDRKCDWISMQVSHTNN